MLDTPETRQHAHVVADTFLELLDDEPELARALLPRAADLALATTLGDAGDFCQSLLEYGHVNAVISIALDRNRPRHLRRGAMTALCSDDEHGDRGLDVTISVARDRAESADARRDALEALEAGTVYEHFQADRIRAAVREIATEDPNYWVRQRAARLLESLED